MNGFIERFGIGAFEVGLFVAALMITNLILKRRLADQPGGQYRRQVWMLVLSAVALLIAVVVMPIGSELRGQILTFLGILISAAIALSSGTLLGNAMAGMMLRSIGTARVGDFVRIGDHFGRITEMDLMHTEIQTEDRDLTTLPNLYLVTNPVKVMRASGTIMSVQVSLGYDVSRRRIERLLLEAARNTQLEDPFVQIVGLGDFSVSYRIAGLLTDVKQLLSTRARLHAEVLDALHGDGIEIVSPNFMNQRILSEDTRFLPKAERHEPQVEASASTPDAVVFDKAEQAESLDQVRQEHESLKTKIKALEEQLVATEEALRVPLTREIETLREEAKALAKAIEDGEAELETAD